MEIDDGGFAFLGEEESVVGARVHEKVLYEYCGRQGVAEDVEVGFEVGVAVGVVGDEAFAGEVETGGFVEAGGQGVGPGVAACGVGTPAGDIVPAVAQSGGGAVDGDENGVVFANLASYLVDTAAAKGKIRSVAQFADLLHVSPRTLSYAVKSASGRTVMDWIHEHTAKVIARELKYSKKSIQEICYSLDFPSLSFFGKFCRKYLGASPREYRQKNG